MAIGRTIGTLGWIESPPLKQRVLFSAERSRRQTDRFQTLQAPAFSGQTPDAKRGKWKFLLMLGPAVLLSALTAGCDNVSIPFISSNPKVFRPQTPAFPDPDLLFPPRKQPPVDTSYLRTSEKPGADCENDGKSIRPVPRTVTEPDEYLSEKDIARAEYLDARTARIVVRSDRKAPSLQNFFFRTPPDEGPGKNIPPDSPESDMDFSQVSRSLGSGWVCQADGVIVTNNHVVDDALKYGGSIEIIIGNKTYDAKVMGNDPVADLAFLKIDTDGEKLPTLHFGTPPRKGEHIVVMGNPLGLNQNYSTGVVSALYQEFGRLGPPGHVTDTAINPGNSGGVAAGLQGDVKGVVNAKAIGPEVDNIGFFIPNEYVQGALRRLSEGKSLNRMSLGVVLAEKNALETLRNQALDDRDMTTAKNLDEAADSLLQYPTETHGFVITEIVKDSIADKTGALKIGDVITSLDGKPVGTLSEFVSGIKTHFEDEAVQLDILRNGAPLTLELQHLDALK